MAKAKKTKSKVSPMFHVVLSHLFKKPATGKYPFVKCVPAQGFRGKQVFDIALCIGCGLCSRDCPAKAIEMVELEGKKRPVFYLDRCIFCYQCAESCARNAIKSTDFFELATTDKASLIMKPKPEPKPAVQPAAQPAAPSSSQKAATEA